jgi:hypothetical protein
MTTRTAVTRQKQIPCGDDNKNGKGESKGKGKGKQIPCGDDNKKGKGKSGDKNSGDKKQKAAASAASIAKPSNSILANWA